MSKNQLVSASTDSSLKLWDLTCSSGSSFLKRTFSGHVNEKNFVGLSVNSASEFMACGSENNSVVVYNKDFGRPLFNYSFSTLSGGGGGNLSRGKMKSVSILVFTSICNFLILCSMKSHLKMIVDNLLVLFVGNVMEIFLLQQILLGP